MVLEHERRLLHQDKLPSWYSCRSAVGQDQERREEEQGGGGGHRAVLANGLRTELQGREIYNVGEQ